MIVICEPQSQGISHEKVNSGFLYGLRMAFPDDTIRLYADDSHLIALKDILEHDNTTIDNIEYIPITFKGSSSAIELFSFYFLFKHIFSATLAAGADKIFFFSFSPTMLFIIKLLKMSPVFSGMKLTFVLHGDFENIADPDDRPIRPSLPGRSRLSAIRQASIFELSRKTVRLVTNYFARLWLSIISKLFPTKKMLLWHHSADFKYIALSPHIITNAKKYIDVEKLNIHTVVMPTIFAPTRSTPTNRFPKFAVFGYGNPAILYKVNRSLARLNINQPFEIRIIGMDNSGTAEFANTTCPSPGKRLPRKEMERYAEDIDIFLILYNPDSYRLSCSASVFESLSYLKPVLHLANDCLNTFNTPANPIGICCKSEEDLAKTMKDIIENYPSFQQQLATFRKNILTKREEFKIENSLLQLKDSFTWN